MSASRCVSWRWRTEALVSLMAAPAISKEEGGVVRWEVESGDAGTAADAG